jgi:Flp pilus assembly protein TadD
MRNFRSRILLIPALAVAVAAIAWLAGYLPHAALTGRPARLVIDYPEEGSVFPPEFPPPQFVWRDADSGETSWEIEITFADGSPPIREHSRGERMQIGEIDPRCVSSTNEPPRLTAEQAEAHTWRPEAAVWEAIKKKSVRGPATVAIRGSHSRNRGRTTLRTSADPVGAPIFYRDVPLMPSETEKGVIKPLAAKSVPLIAWRLRNVAETGSRVLMEGIHSCANCHSMSRDGKTFGMDVDGPHNDKGLYALVPIRPYMSIRNEDIIAWSTFHGKLGGKLRVGFMSQVSPDGRFVVTTIHDTGMDQSDYERRRNPKDLISAYYVANFKDYRFLQVFYPTRGILAWYSRETGHLQPLPGADDPAYVHTTAAWAPDGSYLVFSRAEARDAYPPGVPLAAYANDPAETRIQYDLYRIPFNEGKGGTPEPVRGASRNGMSNNFPKISPDGRWIVYVRCRNGQLMRPDGELYIVPAAGGTARRMRCNTPLMNSWHSFSPNGRWMVFASKSRSPYTQMFLTHIDEDGNDSPAILIENATAANRAVNIPEFVNIPSDGLLKIEAPATEYFRVVDLATELLKSGQYEKAAQEWRKAVELDPSQPTAHNNLGVALAETGKIREAAAHYLKALELSPRYPDAHNNLGELLAGMGKTDDAVAHFRRAVEADPGHAAAHANLGSVLARRGDLDLAIRHFRRAIELQPESVEAHRNLGLALAAKGDLADASQVLERGVELTGERDVALLDMLGRVYGQMGRFADAVQAARRALTEAARRGDAKAAEALKARIAAYEARNSSGPR